MKALVKFLSILFIIGCQSCDKGPTPGPKPEPKPTTFAVTAIAGTGGTVTPNGTTVVESGKDITFTPVEDAGYTLTGIKVNGVSVSVVKPYTLTNVTAITEVKFEFTLIYFLTLSNGADNKSRWWSLKSFEYFDLNNNFLCSINLTGDPRLTDRCYYYTSGKLENFTKDGVRTANGNWSIVGNVFNQGEVNIIVKLTDNEFSYKRQITQPSGVVEWVVITSIRQ